MPRTLLIAEDHLPLQKSLRDWLTSVFPGYEVVTAGNGRDAIEAARGQSPAAVIMDINLPEMNGIEATRLLRKEQPDLPIVILTMYEGEPYRSEAVAAGATVFIPKRRMQAELLPALAQLLPDHSQTIPSVSAAVGPENGGQPTPDIPRYRKSSREGEEPTEILIVEDNPGDARLLREMIRDAKSDIFRISEAGTIRAAVACLEEKSIDVILADLHLPDSNGLDTVRRLLRQSPSLPIIVLTGLNDEELADQAIREGAQDYLLKDELSTYILIRAMRFALERKKTEEQIRRLAYYDSLTGLPNRMLFSDRLAQAITAARRQEAKLALFMLDLDKFKEVNDVLGHRAGDQMLIGVGGRIRQCLRASDTVARFGGDEFVVLLTNMRHEESAAAIATKIMHALASPIEVEGRSLHITASIGVAVYPGHGNDEDTLLKRADIAMYRAKEKGRNAYEIFRE